MEPVESAVHPLIAELTRELESEREARSASDRVLIEAIDCEHQRLARLLHDTSSQTLNAARIYARVARDTLQRSRSEASESLLTLEHVIKSAADEIQGLTRWLQPARLGDSHLLACLSELCQLASRTVPCEFFSTETAIDANAECQQELLRITQLSLHALLRRGGMDAAGPGLSLRFQSDEQYLSVEIGASLHQPLPGHLEPMLEGRARVMGGSFAVQQDARGASTLTCRLPKRPTAQSGSRP